jgi:hypothetical protein
MAANIPAGGKDDRRNMTASELDSWEMRLIKERDRYREEANQLRTVAHHLLEANKAMNAALTCQMSAQTHFQEALAIWLGYDPDSVA